MAPHPNHKYALEQHQQQLFQQQRQQAANELYSTSANQGSVSYVPSNEEHFRLGEQLHQVQVGGEAPAEGAAPRRAEKRFGARLPSKQVVAATSSSSASAPFDVSCG